jgi:hypothetical protein
MDPTVLAELIMMLEPEVQALVLLLVQKLRKIPVAADPIPAPIPVPPVPPAS